MTKYKRWNMTVSLVWRNYVNSTIHSIAAFKKLNEIFKIFTVLKITDMYMHKMRNKNVHQFQSKNGGEKKNLTIWKRQHFPRVKRHFHISSDQHSNCYLSDGVRKSAQEHMGNFKNWNKIQTASVVSFIYFKLSPSTKNLKALIILYIYIFIYLQYFTVAF